MPDKKNVRQYQLYDYCVIDSLRSLGADPKDMNILDLCCGRGGGLNYLAQNYKINKGVGVDISKREINFANNAFSSSGLTFVNEDAELIEDIKELKEFNTGFNVITCLEGIRYVENKTQFLRSLSNFMRIQKEKPCPSDPVVVIADHFSVSEIEKF